MKWILAALLLVLPATAWADGETCEAQGPGRACTKLCTAKAAADASGTCTSFSIGRSTGVLFVVNEDEDCSAYSVIVQVQHDTDGDWHDLKTLSNSGDSYHVHAAPLAGNIRATLTTLTDCTDFELTMEVFD
jgi:hypothetical protein